MTEWTLNANDSSIKVPHDAYEARGGSSQRPSISTSRHIFLLPRLAIIESMATRGERG